MPLFSNGKSEEISDVSKVPEEEESDTSLLSVSEGAYGVDKRVKQFHHKGIGIL